MGLDNSRASEGKDYWSGIGGVTTVERIRMPVR